MSFTLDDLAALIAHRASTAQDTSYTSSLIAGGQAKAGKKFGEEACECVIAAMQIDPKALKMEAADVLYHLLVVLQIGGVTLQDVTEELARRTHQSGLQEKAARTTAQT